MKSLKCHLFGSSGSLSSTIKNVIERDYSEVITYGSSKSANFYCDIKDSSSWPTKLPYGLYILNSWIMAPRNKSIMTQNLEFCSRISDLAKSTNSPLIFISSMSANKSAKSLYGRYKYKVETYIIGNSQKVLRLGLALNQETASESRVVGKVSKYARFASNLLVFLEFESQLRIPVVDLETFEFHLNKLLRDSQGISSLDSFSKYLPLSEILKSDLKTQKLRVKISNSTLLNLVSPIQYINELRLGTGNVTDRILSLLDSCNFYDSV